MKLLRIILIAILFHASLHFSFLEVQAAEDIEVGGQSEELEDELDEEQNDSDPTDDLHNDISDAEKGKDNTEEPIVEEENQENTSTESSVEDEPNEVDSEQSEPEINLFSTDAAEEEPEVTLPYQQGDRHEDLIGIKQRLNAIGFGGISETNYFGGWTKTRVTQFQEYYGISVTGEIDQTTLDKLNEVYNSPFQLGKRHDRTIELKEKLNSLGYGNITVSNLYGDWTKNRVKKFQRENGLRDHGIADERTWGKLNELFSQTEFEVGDRHPNIVSIKKKLNAIGFDRISETDYYGNWTRTRVLQFQEYYDLPATGTTTEVTLEKLEEIYHSPFQLGQRDDRIIELKEKLNSLGYGHISVTNLYGSWTEKRVKKFQDDYGLKNHGIADEKTWAKIDELLSQTDFKVGDRHPNIISIKQKLNAIGFDRISETDYYGNWTKTRVLQFQEYYGLVATGTTTEATLEKLEEIYHSPFQLGQRDDRIIELKEKLNSLGYGHISVSNLYGNWTENRVKKFQSDHGLKDHGIADDKTWAKIDELLSKTEFKLGDRHPELPSLKAKLNFVGFDKISETNYFGNWTKTRVEQFQGYYGIPVNGELDKTTVNKLEEVYNSPYQLGSSHPNMVEYKRMLNALGYGKISVTENFGSWTENRVRKFQRDHDLVENGIIDEVTLKKIEELFEVYELFEISLDEALEMQMNAGPQTDKYRNNPAYISSNYVELGQKGLTISNANVIIRTEPTTKSDNFATLKPNTAVTILGTVNGEKYNGSTTWYKVRYNGQENYVHSTLVNETNTQVAIVTASNLNVRSKANANSHKYGAVSRGMELEVVGQSGSWLQVPYGAWRNATNQDTLAYLDPIKNDKFQHLDLSSPVGATAEELNVYLNDKGILKGTGQAFVDAANMHNINELYLVSHALLETGNGTSDLAKGIEVDGTTVYNMFGIGAYDNCADECGSQRAYNEGWDTPYKAIVGGAKFIGQDYIHNEYKQNTLYKMRWNPKGMVDYDYATHQYATDVAWATKQLSNLKTLHEDLLDDPLLKFNIVVYL